MSTVRDGVENNGALRSTVYELDPAHIAYGRYVEWRVGATMIAGEGSHPLWNRGQRGTGQLGGAAQIRDNRIIRAMK